MKPIMAVVLAMVLAGSVMAAQAQQGTATATTTKSAQKKKVAKASGPAISEQLSEMKQAIDAQQQQIKQLSDLVQSRDQKIQQLEQRLDQSQTAATRAQTKADTAVAQTAQQEQTVMALKSDVTDLKTTATNSALTLQETQKSVRDAMESPLAIHFKGITITPGGFLAAESVYRNRAMASDINTPFNSVSMPGSGANAMSEFFGSGRQSRISMLAEGKLNDIKMSGYYEADFLSAGVTSNNNQSNSYTLRQRQVWGQAALTNGWSFTGGQMWSLVTETKKGVDNRSEALPMTIDAAVYGRFQLGAAVRFPRGQELQQSLLAGRFAGKSSDYLLGHQQCLRTSLLAAPAAAADCITAAAAWVTPAQRSPTIRSTRCRTSSSRRPLNPASATMKSSASLAVSATAFIPAWNLLSARACALPRGATAATGAYNDSKNGGGVGGNARVTMCQAGGFRSPRSLRERCRPVRHDESAGCHGEPRWHAGSLAELSGSGHIGMAHAQD